MHNCYSTVWKRSNLFCLLFLFLILHIHCTSYSLYNSSNLVFRKAGVETGALSSSSAKVGPPVLQMIIEQSDMNEWTFNPQVQWRIFQFDIVHWSYIVDPDNINAHTCNCNQLWNIQHQILWMIMTSILIRVLFQSHFIKLKTNTPHLLYPGTGWEHGSRSQTLWLVSWKLQKFLRCKCRKGDIINWCFSFSSGVMFLNAISINNYHINAVNFGQVSGG